jgi:hypothetical protein
MALLVRVKQQQIELSVMIWNVGIGDQDCTFLLISKICFRGIEQSLQN